MDNFFGMVLRLNSLPSEKICVAEHQKIFFLNFKTSDMLFVEYDQKITFGRSISSSDFIIYDEQSTVPAGVDS